MKITRIESLHADGGWRTLDFLKISTDEGLVGWSEYNESFGGVGVSAAIAGLAPALIGKDPRPWEAIIDTPWNGIGESLKIAAMADAYEINVAPHNFYGHLATMMNAHWSAVVPNLRIMEIDPDMVPWQDDLVTVTPRIENGHLLLPTGPGWGTEVNEEAVRAHPPRTGR